MQEQACLDINNIWWCAALKLQHAHEKSQSWRNVSWALCCLATMWLLKVATIFHFYTMLLWDFIVLDKRQSSQKQTWIEDIAVTVPHATGSSEDEQLAAPDSRGMPKSAGGSLPWSMRWVIEDLTGYFAVVWPDVSTHRRARVRGSALIGKALHSTSSVAVFSPVLEPAVLAPNSA